MSTVRISGIESESVVDGPGLRFTLFVQGCERACPGCHNPQTHDKNGGRLAETDDILKEFLSDPLVTGITFSGGEPFLQPAPLVELAQAAHAAKKHVLAFSGYTFEQLLELGEEKPAVAALLAELDALIDGPYIAALRNLEIGFMGSSNQRYLERKDMDALRQAWQSRKKLRLDS